MNSQPIRGVNRDALPGPRAIGSNALRAQANRGEDIRWQALGLCGQTDPEAFFPQQGGSTKAAKEICRRCEVTAQCLEYAIEHEEYIGIWGGKTGREIQQLRTQRNRQRRQR